MDAENSTPTPDSIIFSIGDIGISQSEVITPNGVAPLAKSMWIAKDATTTRKTIPTYAIVLAIIFALACFLGLLFLLIKEERVEGYVEVSVTSGNLHYMTQIPASNYATVSQVKMQVSQAQSMARAA